MHAAPMYIAETAPSQIRGTLISLKEFFIVIGMLVSAATVVTVHLHISLFFSLGFLLIFFFLLLFFSICSLATLAAVSMLNWLLDGAICMLLVRLYVLLWD